MPRITRKKVSLLESPAVRFGGAVVGISGILALGAIFFGMSDKGTIDVSGKISSADQSGFVKPVNTLNNSASINGGLKPKVVDPNEVKAPEPEPVVDEETASTTTDGSEDVSTEEATDTETVAADTETSSDSEPTETEETL